jgi:hypothetical protein
MTVCPDDRHRRLAKYIKTPLLAKVTDLDAKTVGSSIYSLASLFVQKIQDYPLTLEQLL